MESSPDRPRRRRQPGRRGADASAGSALRAELAAIYRRADELAAAAAHDGCTRCAHCCQFALLGREPYVTAIELEVLVAGWRRIGAKVKAAAGKALKICPLLTSELRCAAYADRPLGCRTFWCRSAVSDDRAADRRAVLTLVREVKAVAERHCPGGEQGRPLWTALRARVRRP
jgi:Fe-S-cluster containining protein